MAEFVTIRIYGTDTDYGVAYKVSTDLDTDSVKYIDIDAMIVESFPEMKITEITDANNRKMTLKIVRSKIIIEGEVEGYPESGIKAEEFAGVQNAAGDEILTKNFHFINFGTFNLRPKVTWGASTYSIAAALMSHKVTNTPNAGVYTLRLEFESEYLTY